MLRRLAPVQPESFEFTPANLAWARAQMTKFPEGRQASAIIPILWRAHEQEGWLSRPAIEYVADMLGMPYIRGLEVATFYFMFQLQPVGRIANIQICGTTTCMICGAEDLIAVCREKIAPEPHTLSADGNFSWEEVECAGACANAPMAQIGKDYYEDLTPQKLAELIDAMAAGQVPVPGPQNGRYASEPLGGATTLSDQAPPVLRYNASAQAAVDLRDTLKRIDGREVPLRTPWLTAGEDVDVPAEIEPQPGAGIAVDATGVTVQEAQAGSPGRPAGAREPDAAAARLQDVDPGEATVRRQPAAEGGGRSEGGG
ncbi:NADH-quinone oxidoreductase subunit NuoE [Paracoccus sp. S-4012]|uniref:NADH-quinone oxidoreductase subunit NuoE n=1 Tax=Paracoccus sp. S-4012 TaxID=2665648 RepID=UPI0012B15FA5|nr:NADH-quinone oxidoreductase subunit NuoE [Paracoccus sp. S-4012]MRX50602.1 NADH-quinone oxidoreductase subunit NuoE [Paracoccus sp. S-4012]